MAERYPPGLVKLWYRATAFTEGVDVRGDIRRPDGTKNTDVLFTEDGDGLYFLDYDFTMFGSYVVVISENGARKTSQNFYIEKPPSGGSSIPSGSNLLNTYGGS